jgi:GntR family transcriptional regulator
MFLRIQRGAAVPISRQIEGQIRAQILSGTLAAEDQLPSVRQLARELAVNVNTVLRVYERLAAGGLIELRHGDGTYVSRRAKGGATAELAQKRRELVQDFDALTRRGLMLGLEAEELTQIVAESLERAAAATGDPAQRSSDNAPRGAKAKTEVRGR